MRSGQHGNMPVLVVLCSRDTRLVSVLRELTARLEGLSARLEPVRESPEALDLLRAAAGSAVLALHAGHTPMAGGFAALGLRVSEDAALAHVALLVIAGPPIPRRYARLMIELAHHVVEADRIAAHARELEFALHRTLAQHVRTQAARHAARKAVLGDLIVAPDDRFVFRNGTPLPLPRGDVRFLSEMARSQGHLISHSAAVRAFAVRNAKDPGRSVANRVSSLRKRLGRAGCKIRAIRGIGWHWTNDG